MKAELLEDLKKILETVPTITKVSHGKAEPLTSETNFNSIYIVPEISTFENRTNKKGLSSYLEIFPVSLIVNTNNNNPLDYIQVERDIINYVLDDSKIWSKLFDREVSTIGYDRYDNFPKKEFIIQFEFKLIEPCKV